jgi:hypothetical protein
MWHWPLGLAADQRWLRGVSFSAVLVLLVCQLGGMMELWGNGEYFAHGPHRQIQLLLD